MSFDAASVLPGNSTRLEKELARVTGRVLNTPVPIRDLWDVDECPVELLPYLAAAWSVDFWDANWPEPKKRSMIRNAVKHHRMKGTLAGIEAYADIAGAEVIRVIRPPMKLFASGSSTVEQRLAWLDSLPKVKIYRNTGKSAPRPALIAGGGARPFFLSRRFAYPNLASEHAQTRALLIRDGVETEVGVGFDFSGYRIVKLRGQAGARAFASFIVGRAVVPSNASKSIARISAETMAEDPALANPLRPAGTGNGIFPTLSSDPAPIGRSWFASALAYKRYAGRSDARFRAFEQIPLADDLSPPEPRLATGFASYTRISVPAHTAELKVGIPSKGTKSGYFAGARRAGSFAVPNDKSHVHKAMVAMRSAKALADMVLIDTSTYRPFRAGQTRIAGQTIIAGQWSRG